MGRKERVALAGLLALLALAATPRAAAAADAVLSGTVAAASGEKLGGVAVSAKADGATVTTSVYTDAAGAYYFPALPAGRYRVWAQAASFAPAKDEVDLAGARRHDFVLAPTEEVERQLTGDQLLASLPAATEEDRRLKRLVHNNCSGCHTPSYILQHRFDEAGWNAIIELMKRVNVGGVYQGPDAKPNGILDFNQKRLATYLARVRGPGPSELKLALRPRPAGEAARIVVREYDVPLDPAQGVANKYVLNDGGDWSRGTPSALEGGRGVHDAWADLEGNLWYTNNSPSPNVSIGRIEARTGEVRFIKIAGADGWAANAHGMTRDPEGILWFNIGPTSEPGRAGLARLDPRSEKIEIFVPPKPMSPTGGAVTVDFDGKGKIWVSSPDGVLRFDPATQQFTEFKSLTPKNAQGTGLTYGVAADRSGNGWWASMAIDIVGHSDVASAKSLEVKLPPLAAEMDRLTPEERAFYEKFSGTDFNTPLPWSQGPRRMGADKAGDIVWVCDFWGGSLARIDTRTFETGFVALPDQENQHPYHATVDSRHNVWINMMNADQVLRYDPASGAWSRFDLPSLGAETRYVSLREHDGTVDVVLPYSRTSRVAVMSFRTEAEVAALAKSASR